MSENDGRCPRVDRRTFLQATAAAAMAGCAPTDPEAFDADVVRRWVPGPGFVRGRDQGYDGMTFGFGVAGVTFDNSPADGSAGVILAFAEPDDLPDDDDGRRDALAEALVGAFGEQARQVEGFAQMDWADDRWSSGPVAPLPPGVLTQWGRALRAPVGRLFWAGTDTATVWNGSMEGALRAGERAAAEVIAAMPVPG